MTAAKGANTIASIESIRLAIFSPVETTGLPIPAVMAVDTPLVTTVAPFPNKEMCVRDTSRRV